MNLEVIDYPLPNQSLNFMEFFYSDVDFCLNLCSQFYLFTDYLLPSSKQDLSSIVRDTVAIALVYASIFILFLLLATLTLNYN